jgi:phage-related protein
MSTTSNATSDEDPRADKPIIWLGSRENLLVPPLQRQTQRKAGFLLRQLQMGVKLVDPDFKPMRTIGKNCHGLRLTDAKRGELRIIDRIDRDAILVVDVFFKKSRSTENQVIDRCKSILVEYDRT